MTESGSAEVEQLLSNTIVSTSRISELEVTSALARRCREGHFPAADRDRALAALRHDFSTFFVIELSSDVTQAASHLLLRYSLRAADALHLASSLELRRRLRFPVTFVVFDEQLRAAARAEGLVVEP